jgi:hypothetical protein
VPPAVKFEGPSYSLTSPASKSHQATANPLGYTQ